MTSIEFYELYSNTNTPEGANVTSPSFIRLINAIIRRKQYENLKKNR